LSTKTCERLFVTRILHLPVIEVHTLTDGGQTAVDIARIIAAFVDEAKETLELALYDIRLHDETADIVRGALVGAHERGVNVRLVYNVDEVDERPPVPPPPKTEPSLILGEGQCREPFEGGRKEIRSGGFGISGRLCVPGADILAIVTTKYSRPDHGSKFTGNGATKFNSQVGNA
jgi:hypothetical protein